MAQAPAACPPLRLDVEVSGDLQKESLRVLGATRPSWSPEQVKFKVFTDGITNKLLGCYVDNHKEDVVLIRIYGEKTDLFIDRTAEVRNIQLLHEWGCAPPLYAIFRNGLAYEFVHGDMVTVDTCRNADVFHAVCHEMAAFHCVSSAPNSPDGPAENGSLLHDPGLRSPCLWRKMKKYFALTPEAFEDSKMQERYAREIPSKASLWKEIEELESTLSQTGSPVVFCHNDILLGNIVFNKGQRKVTFIDYEYADYNYQAYDIANHFNEFAGVDEVDYSLFPEKEFQLEWLRVYLEAFQAKKGWGSHRSVPSKDIERLYVQVNMFTLASHVFWTLWALIQAKYSTIDFDFLGYAILRYGEYKQRKPQFLSMELPS